MSTGSRGDGWVFQAYVLSRMRSDTVCQIVTGVADQETPKTTVMCCARGDQSESLQMFGLSIAHPDETTSLPV
jgi:hypothetical protein